MEKLLFAADLHGNIGQYQKVLAHAKENNFDVVIFGGDLTPKNPERRTPKGQRDFIEKELFPLLGSRDAEEPHALFIMGNDDFRSNHEVMVDGQEFYHYRMIDQIPYISKEGHVIFGYSYVPYTPFQYKCWERRDLESDTDFSHRADIRQTGVISQGDELVPYALQDTMMDSSIERDLTKILSAYDPRKTILVSYAPPNDTVCDLNKHNQHVGSRALRKLVENKQPLMTLSGHIHETVDLTGQFYQQIGESFCVAVGSDHKPDSPYVVEIELGDTISLKRCQLQYLH